MGIVLQVAHPSEVFEEEYAECVLRELTAALGPDVGLGIRGRRWSTGDTVIGEMGWSWWSEMQALVGTTLGAGRAVQVRGVDAWQGVYVDARIGPGVLDSGVIRPAHPRRPPGLLKRLMAMRRAKQGDTTVLINGMVATYGPSEADRSLLQVADVRGLHEELEAAIRALGHAPDDAAMDALLAGYYDESMERCDEDTCLQCLAHAWGAACKALAMDSPLWLVK